MRGFISRVFDVLSGVSQGSSLGPLLFILFINELFLLITVCFILFYADDVKLSKAITCVADSEGLQSELTILINWCTENGLRVNLKKPAVITFHLNKLPFTQFDYYTNGVGINRVHEITDLGAIFDSRLTFRSHLNSVLASASRVLDLITRNSGEFKNPKTYLQLYKSYVFPILTYASVVWSPYLNYDVDSLELIQLQQILGDTFEIYERADAQV